MTCDQCLDANHYRCSGLGCSCSVCKKNHAALDVKVTVKERAKEKSKPRREPKKPPGGRRGERSDPADTKRRPDRPKRRAMVVVPWIFVDGKWKPPYPDQGPEPCPSGHSAEVVPFARLGDGVDYWACLAHNTIFGLART